MEHHEFWQKVEAILRKYERAYTPVRWFRNWGGMTRGREGYFDFLRFAFLIGLYLAAFFLPLSIWSKMALAMVSSYLIADMFMLPTSIAFGGIPAAMRPLRALVLVFVSYLSIAVAFGVLYVTLCRSSFNMVPDLVDLVYFSFTTMTALGMGDISPARHTVLVRFLVVSEILIGLYFWAVVVGMIVSWTTREVSSLRKE